MYHLVRTLSFNRKIPFIAYKVQSRLRLMAEGNSIHVLSRNMSSLKSTSTVMKDEYGEMDSSGETFMAKNFVLESGETLKEAHVCIFEAWNCI